MGGSGDMISFWCRPSVARFLGTNSQEVDSTVNLILTLKERTGVELAGLEGV